MKISKKDINKLIRIAENGDSLSSKAAMRFLRRINKTYHWCPDWDYMVICDKSSEYDCCLCKK